MIRAALSAVTQTSVLRTHSSRIFLAHGRFLSFLIAIKLIDLRASLRPTLPPLSLQFFSKGLRPVERRRQNLLTSDSTSIALLDYRTAVQLTHHHLFRDNGLYFGLSVVLLNHIA
jgi:hypothetical protein